MNKGTVYQVFVSNEKGDLVKIGTINGKIPSKKNCELMRIQVEVNKRLSYSSLIDKSIILEDYIELDGSTNYGEVMNLLFCSRKRTSVCLFSGEEHCLVLFDVLLSTEQFNNRILLADRGWAVKKDLSKEELKFHESFQ